MLVRRARCSITIDSGLPVDPEVYSTYATFSGFTGGGSLSMVSASVSADGKQQPCPQHHSRGLMPEGVLKWTVRPDPGLLFATTFEGSKGLSSTKAPQPSSLPKLPQQTILTYRNIPGPGFPALPVRQWLSNWPSDQNALQALRTLSCHPISKLPHYQVSPICTAR